jgi:ADP-ribose pyrophosphatase YjhB (NUDIX family)
MNYKEYKEGGMDISLLETSFIDQKDYEMIHRNTVILCHDVFIRTTYNGVQGILLVTRLNEPAKNIVWPIGGRILRGVSTEESLARKALDECSLRLSNIQYLGTARTFFKGEPFGHGNGTDTLNLIYLADGEGELKLNAVHEAPHIITREEYVRTRETFVPYVQEFLDEIERKNLWQKIHTK